MSVNVIEYIDKLQEEGLKTLKQAQDASLAAFGEFRKAATEFTTKPGTVPTFENVPTPAQFVEMSFGFANRLLDARKGYALKVAELIAEGQKQADAAVKATVAQVNQVVGQAPKAAK